MAHGAFTSGEQRESSIQQLHSFLLRQRPVVYTAILGVAIAAIVLAVIFASGAVDVAGPRWPWLIDLAVLVAFSVARWASIASWR